LRGNQQAGGMRGQASYEAVKYILSDKCQIIKEATKAMTIDVNENIARYIVEW